MSNKREYCVGIKIINCFYVGAKTRDEAIEKVRDMTNEEILLDSDFNIEYADPTNGEIAWKIKSTEYDLVDDEHGNILY
jgi:predicted metal-dependent TIM-barrel fold hydrolase